MREIIQKTAPRGISVSLLFTTTSFISISFSQTLFAEDTEVGKLYELVVTNLSGLYRYRIGDVVKISRFHNNCPVVEYQYRQGQILNVRAEKTSERAFYDSLTSALSDEGQRFHLVDYTCAESIMLDDESHVLRGDDVRDAAPFYVVFLELSGGGLKDEERKDFEAKVGYIYGKVVIKLARQAMGMHDIWLLIEKERKKEYKRVDVQPSGAKGWIQNEEQP